MVRIVENLAHFLCDHCSKWWAIGDAPEDKKEWYCPWCGKLNHDHHQEILSTKEFWENFHPRRLM
jgi:hypothetical protein